MRSRFGCAFFIYIVLIYSRVATWLRIFYLEISALVVACRYLTKFSLSFVCSLCLSACRCAGGGISKNDRLASFIPTRPKSCWFLLSPWDFGQGERTSPARRIKDSSNPLRCRRQDRGVGMVHNAQSQNHQE